MRGACVATPRLVAFDLDDTLAPSKSAIDPRIGDLLVALAERVEVAIISGGQLAQFTAQVVDRLPDDHGRGPLARPPAPDLRHAVLPARPQDGVRHGLRALADRRREVARARRRRGRGASPRPLGVRDLGRHPRGPRLADHVLGPRPDGAARGEDRVGPDRREEERPARGSGCEAPRPRGALGRLHLGRHHPAGHRQGLRHASARRADRHPARPTCSSSATASTRTATTTPCSRWASPATRSTGGKTPPSSSSSSSPRLPG